MRSYRCMAEPHDYVIVGAGSAGCVLANRLTARGARVLLIEAGGSDHKLRVKAPVAFPELFQGPNDWNYVSEPEPCGRGQHACPDARKGTRFAIRGVGGTCGRGQHACPDARKGTRLAYGESVLTIITLHGA
jgi:choline dehydrogenase-like flavoprotein